MFRTLDLRPDHPMVFQIDDFCALALGELEDNPLLDAHVTEIRHYKEKGGVEHEFLLAHISFTQKPYVLRLERTTRSQQRRPSLLKRFRQSSSLNMPAGDMVRICAQEKSAIDVGGEVCIRVASLPFSTQRPFPLRELCLILSFFSWLSPEYLLLKQQCYWFCDVVLFTACTMHGDSTAVIKGEGFEQAGCFRGVHFLQVSAPTRQLFLNVYSIMRRVEASSEPSEVPPELLQTDTADILVKLLAVPSSKVRSCTVVALTRIAKHSPEHRQMVVEARAIPGLIRYAASRSVQPSLVLEALHAIFDESSSKTFEPTDLEILVEFLSRSLSSTDQDISHKSASLLSIAAFADTGESAFATLISNLSAVESPLHSKLAALQGITFHLKRRSQRITQELIVPLADIVSSQALSPEIRGRAAEILFVVIRDVNEPGLDTLRTAGIKIMSGLESEELKEIVFSAVYNAVTPSTTALERKLSDAGFLPAFEQLLFAHDDDWRRWFVFKRVLQQWTARYPNTAHPFDSRLPHSLLAFIKRKDLDNKLSAFSVVAMLARTSAQFSRNVCELGAPEAIAGLEWGIWAEDAVDAVCALSVWKPCWGKLANASLLPPGEEYRQVDREVVKAHLRKQFPSGSWLE